MEGVDVYGSFLIGITLKDKDGQTVYHKDGEELAQFPVNDIRNEYVAKVAPGKHSLVIPLGAKAVLTCKNAVPKELPASNYELVLTDISGATWTSNVQVTPK